MSDGVRRGGSAEPGLSRDAIRKETVMAYEWQSVEEAAVTLAISTRTLHRRISKGEVETRLEDGRREVLVCLPDPEPEVTEEPAEVADTSPMRASFNPPTSSTITPRSSLPKRKWRWRTRRSVARN